jgi:hypothetical protein
MAILLIGIYEPDGTLMALILDQVYNVLPEEKVKMASLG